VAFAKKKKWSFFSFLFSCPLVPLALCFAKKKTFRLKKAMLFLA
jgi:maltodextrin utilization protein YvdJ